MSHDHDLCEHDHPAIKDHVGNEYDTVHMCFLTGQIGLKMLAN